MAAISPLILRKPVGQDRIWVQGDAQNEWCVAKGTQHRAITDHLYATKPSGIYIFEDEAGWVSYRICSDPHALPVWQASVSGARVCSYTPGHTITSLADGVTRAIHVAQDQPTRPHNGAGETRKREHLQWV